MFGTINIMQIVASKTRQTSLIDRSCIMNADEIGEKLKTRAVQIIQLHYIKVKDNL